MGYYGGRLKRSAKSLILAACVGSTLFAASLLSSADALEVGGTVDILQATCGLDSGGISTLDYGELVNGQVSAPANMAIENTGNTATLVFISGTDWTSAGLANPVMLVDSTHYDKAGAGGLWEDYDPLTTTPTDISPFNGLAPGNFISMIFKLKAQLLNQDFSGTATQTVTFTGEC